MEVKDNSYKHIEELNKHGEKLEEILGLLESFKSSHNAFNNTAIQEKLLEMDLNKDQISQMQTAKADNIAKSMHLVNSSDLAFASQNTIKRSRPFDIKYIEDIEIDENMVCGKGSYGIVYLIQKSGIQLAAKKLIDVPFSNPDVTVLDSSEILVKQLVMAEIKAYQKLQNCPFIVRFYGISAVDNCLTLITEYIGNKSLDYWLYANSTEISNDIVRHIAHGIAQGLVSLHYFGVAHNDIKSNNIMLDFFWTPKIIDLGMAKVQNASSFASSLGSKRSVGTAQWKAPEYWAPASLENKRIIKKNPYAGDVYSYAVVLGELFTKEMPWEDFDSHSIEKGVLQCNRPYDIHSPGLFSDLINIMDSCWKHDPSQRIPMEEVVAQLEKIGINGYSLYSSQSDNKPLALHALKHQDSAINGLSSSVEVIKYKNQDSGICASTKPSVDIEDVTDSITSLDIINIDFDPAEIKETATDYYKKGLAFAKPFNFHLSLYWFKKSADLNHPASYNKLGSLYENLMNERDYKIAMDYYIKGATLYDSNAMNNIGILYNDGKGVPKDCKHALKWYLKSAAYDNSNAMNNIGVIYDHGLQVGKNLQVALDWYLKSAHLSNSTAMYHLGAIYTDDQPKVALEWYLKSAKLGNVAAMNNVGVMYRYGLGTTSSYTTAIGWCTKAAELGSTVGVKNLNAMNLNDEDVSIRDQKDLITIRHKCLARDDLHEIVDVV